MSDKDHPIWPIIRVTMTGIVLTLFLKFNYNYFDKRDIVTIIGVIGSGSLMEMLKSKKE